MPSYTPIDLERIAAAIGVSSAVIEEQASRFASAALWYRLDRGPLDPGCRPPESRIPYDRRKKMDQIARGARRLRMKLTNGKVKGERVGASFRRLLKDLEIDESAVEDGPGDPEVLQLLTYPQGRSEAHVLSAIRQLGCRPELEAGIAAAAELERLASEAAAEAGKLGRLIVPKDNTGAFIVRSPGVIRRRRSARRRDRMRGEKADRCSASFKPPASRSASSFPRPPGAAGSDLSSRQARNKTDVGLAISTDAQRPPNSGTRCRTKTHRSIQTRALVLMR